MLKIINNHLVTKCQNNLAFFRGAKTSQPSGIFESECANGEKT